MISVTVAVLFYNKFRFFFLSTTFLRLTNIKKEYTHAWNSHLHLHTKFCQFVLSLQYDWAGINSTQWNGHLVSFFSFHSLLASRFSLLFSFLLLCIIHVSTFYRNIWSGCGASLLLLWLLFSLNFVSNLCTHVFLFFSLISTFSFFFFFLQSSSCCVCVCVHHEGELWRHQPCLHMYNIHYSFYYIYIYLLLIFCSAHSL